MKYNYFNVWDNAKCIADADCSYTGKWETTFVGKIWRKYRNNFYPSFSLLKMYCYIFLAIHFNGKENRLIFREK